MAGHDGQETRGKQSGKQGAAGQPAAWRSGPATMPGCPEFPTNISARTARRARSGPGSSTPLPTLAPADIERRFGSADRHLREAGVTYRAPGETADRLWPLSHLPLMIDEADWQQLTAGIAQRARTARAGAGRSLWRGTAGGRGRDPRRGDCRQQRISARGVRHQTAGRPLSQHLCRRCRPRARRALVGAGRPHPGAVGRGLCAGKSAGAVARLHLALQVDECRARGAVLRGVPRQLARQRRPRRAAHRAADARQLQRNLFRARHAGALSRLPAGRGRRSRRQRRPHSYPHRRRPEAARRAAAPGRFQFARSAGARCLLASRRARPDRRAAQERRRGRQHAGLGRDGGAGAARLPAQPERSVSSAKI